MNRDQLEELAALHVLGLLEGEELRAFERELETNAAARQVVADLHAAAASLAVTTDEVAPPAGLRGRVLAALPDRKSTAGASASPAQPVSAKDNLVSFRWIPWAVAACLALTAGLLFVNNRSLQNQVTTLATERESARRELAAIIVERQGLQDRVALLEQSRIFDRLQIATLQTQGNASPNAGAVAAWDPQTQQGLLKVVNLPPLAANRDYQLWVVDPRYPDPVAGGVFDTTASGDGRLVFKPSQDISQAAGFAVSDAPQGGEPKATGPIVLLGK